MGAWDQGKGKGTAAAEDQSPERSVWLDVRWRYGLVAVVTGLLVILVAFGSALTRYATAADVATVMGTVTGVVGTLVGAYFGVQAGVAGRTNDDETMLRLEEARRQRADLELQLEELRRSQR